MSQWIKCRDRLPAADSLVILFLYGCRVIAVLDDAHDDTPGNYAWCYLDYEKIADVYEASHWMPLPPPPETQP